MGAFGPKTLALMKERFHASLWQRREAMQQPHALALVCHLNIFLFCFIHCISFAYFVFHFAFAFNRSSSNI